MSAKNLFIVLLGVLALSTALSVLKAQATSPHSVWDGVYTDEQAKRGEPKYREHCADCHGEDLEGDAEAPPLSGGTFQTNWNGLPLGSLYQRIRRDMPLNKNVGTLSPSVNADLLAYILKVNGFPAGRAELPHTAEVLNEIRFESARPDRRK